jgi:hypothetical protein
MPKPPRDVASRVPARRAAIAFRGDNKSTEIVGANLTWKTIGQEILDPDEPLAASCRLFFRTVTDCVQPCGHSSGV